MKYIILRIDDLGKINNNIIFEKMLLYLKECNINVTMGLIPCYLKTNDQILNLWNIDNRNEIALHGYKHKKYNNVPEFSKIKYFRAVRLLKRSKKLIYKYLKIIPTTFIPPYNKISNQAILALIKQDFNIYSSGKINNRSHRSDKIKINNIPYDYIPSDLRSECNFKKNITVIMIHPYDYMDDRSDFNQKLFESDIQKLISLGYEFRTFSQLNI